MDVDVIKLQYLPVYHHIQATVGGDGQKWYILRTTKYLGGACSGINCGQHIVVLEFRRRPSVVWHGALAFEGSNGKV